MGQALKLAVAALSMGLSVPALSARQSESVRPVDVEINKLDWEVDRLKKAGQYDAALAAALKVLQLAEGADGANTERVGHFYTQVGSLYLRKRDNVSAEGAYKRAFAIFEQKYGQRLPAWGCYIPALLASLIGRPAEMDAKIAYYERAVACYEATPKPGTADAAETAFQLAYYYRYRRERSDLTAKAGPLLDRWIPIAERDLGPDRYEVARLIRARSEVYSERGDEANARAMRLRALAVLSRGPGPAKGDRAKLKEEGQVLLSLMNMYRLSGPDETYVGYQARYAAILEQTEGPASRLTISAREALANLRERFPNWQPPGTASSAPTQVNQAAVSSPVKPSPGSSGARIVQAVAIKAGKPPVWPADMEPGNLYFVVDIRADRFYGDGRVVPLMVAAATPQEAVDRVRRADEATGRTTEGYRLLNGGECKGPAWGAVIIGNGRHSWGGGCGKTPAQAIEAAFAACRQNGPGNCDTVSDDWRMRPYVALALSGSTSWHGKSCGPGSVSCFPSMADRFGSFNAFTDNPHLDANFIHGMQDAISKLGKLCDESYPCFYTAATIKCFHETPSDTRGAICTDKRLSPNGYSGSIRGQREPG